MSARSDAAPREDDAREDREDGHGKRRVLLINAALRGITEIAGKAASIVLFAVIAHRLGEVAVGHYVTVLALTQILWTVADFGTNRWLLREIAADRDAMRHLLADAVGLKVATASALILASTIVAAAVGAGETMTALIALLGISMILDLASTIPIAVFVAHEQMRYYTYAAIPNKYLQAALGIAVILAGGGIVAVGAAAAASSLVALVIAVWLLLRHYPRAERNVSITRWPRMARSAGLFGVQDVLAQVVMRIDTVLLSLLVAGAAVGWYGASYRLIDATLFISWSIVISATPMYTYLSSTSRPTIGEIYGDSVRLVLMLVVPVATTLFVCAHDIVNLAFGLEDFAPSVDILRVLAFSPIFYALSNQAATLVLSRTSGIVVVRIFAIGAALNIVLNVVLVSAFSYKAAAWVTLGTEALLALLCQLAARRLTAGLPWPRLLAAPALGGLAMAAVMLATGPTLWLAVPLGGLVYLGVIALIEVRLLGGSLRPVRAIEPLELVEP